MNEETYTKQITNIKDLGEKLKQLNQDELKYCAGYISAMYDVAKKAQQEA